MTLTQFISVLSFAVLIIVLLGSFADLILPMPPTDKPTEPRPGMTTDVDSERTKALRRKLNRAIEEDMLSRLREARQYTYDSLNEEKLK